jgi:hypothetical protein
MIDLNEEKGVDIIAQPIDDVGGHAVEELYNPLQVTSQILVS